MSSDEQRVAERPRVAFITGAAGGIGRGIAEHLAELGYSISLSDISETGLRAVAKDITEATGVAMSTSAADLADRESVQAAVDATVSRLGGLDVLVNCAGILKDARIEKMEPAVFRQVLDVNLIGMLTTTAAALPALRSSETGRIISLTSRAWLGNFGSTNYAASKGGIAGVSRSLSLLSPLTASPSTALRPVHRNTDVEFDARRDHRAGASIHPGRSSGAAHRCRTHGCVPRRRQRRLRDRAEHPGMRRTKHQRLDEERHRFVITRRGQRMARAEVFSESPEG